jgi:hypothetical protein
MNYLSVSLNSTETVSGVITPLPFSIEGTYLGLSMA